MLVGSLILEFVLISSLVLPLLQLVVPNMLALWCCGRSFVFCRKRSSVFDKNSANASVTRRRERNVNLKLFHCKTGKKCIHNFVIHIQILSKYVSDNLLKRALY